MTLAEISPDAEYRGDGPLYEWDAAAGAWVSFRDVRLVLESGDLLPEVKKARVAG